MIAFQAKKNKNQWQPILEEVITLLLDTCIKSQNFKAVKDGLHQYRTICFPSNSSSLEKVIYEFLVKGDTLVAEAKKKGSNDTNADDESIESKILRSVSGDAFEDRNERTHIQPFIKFLWESFRAILDLVRNKPKLELTYFNTSVQAMRFCVTYDRKQEFKRIGEMLRSHFQQLITHGAANNAMISIESIQASQNSLNCLYGARFEYLNCSVRLELWQEAFRTVEDINEVMMIVKRQPVAQRMANYFEKLAQLFWTSHNYVFHAYSWLRFYIISRDQNRSLTEEDLQRLASVVLVAAISVPVEESNIEKTKNHQDFFELHLEKEKNSRLSALLGKSTTLRREQLLKEIIHHDIPSKALPELRELFHLAETKFHPMELCNSLSGVFDFIQENSALSRYSVLLKKACFTRQLQQLSRVFQTMKIERIYQLAPVSCPHQVEKLIVRCTSSGLVSARIDHRSKTLTFLTTALDSGAIKSNLFSVYESLHSAVKLIQPEKETALCEAKKEFFEIVPQMAEREYKENLTRFDDIEDEKEKKETIDRLKLRLSELRAQLDQINNPSLDQQVKPEEDKKQTAEQKELAKARNQAEEKKIALQKKFNRLFVKLDYLERARREEEAPLLNQVFEESTKQDRELYDRKTKQYLKKQEEEHKKDLEQKKRLAKMKDEAAKLQEELLSAKRKLYEDKLAEIKKHNEAIRAKILAEQEKVRKQKIQEEKERRKLAEARRLAEEKQRKEDEERRQKEAEQRPKSWADDVVESPPASSVRTWGSKVAGESSGSRGAAWGKAARTSQDGIPSVPRTCVKPVSREPESGGRTRPTWGSDRGSRERDTAPRSSGYSNTGRDSTRQDAGKWGRGDSSGSRGSRYSERDNSSGGSHFTSKFSSGDSGRDRGSDRGDRGSDRGDRGSSYGGGSRYSGSRGPSSSGGSSFSSRHSFGDRNPDSQSDRGSSSGSQYSSDPRRGGSSRGWGRK